MKSPLLRYIRRAEIVAVLAHRSFRNLFLARVISGLGDAIYFVALPWLVLEESGSPMALGFTLSAAAIPYIFMGPIAGVVADRMDRKLLMILSHAVQATVLTALIAAEQLLELGVLHYAAGAFLITAAGQLFYPARAAILPNLVPKEELVAGNAALAAGSRSIDIGGKAAGGVLVAAIGGLNAFGVILVTYGLAALLLSRVKAPKQTRLQSTLAQGVQLHSRLIGILKDAMRDFALSVRFIFSHPLLRALALAGLVLNAFHYPTMGIFLPAYLNRELGAGPEAFGLFGSFESAAVLIALPAIPWLARRLGDGRVSLIALAALGILVAGLAIVGQLWQVFAIAVFGGLMTAGVLPMQSLVQAESPDHMRGKVVANLAAINIVLVLFTGPLMGALFEVTGARPLYLVAGMVVLLSGVALFMVREVRQARLAAH